MSLRMCIDQVNGVQPPDVPIPVELGTPIAISGWAVDLEIGDGPEILARTDADSGVVRGTPTVRDDVARHFNNSAFRTSGFSVTLDTKLSLGVHSVILGIDRNGAFVQAAVVRVVCVESLGSGSKPWPRVLLAACPKSGSTFTWSVLKKYLGTDDPPIAGMAWLREQNLDGWILDRIRDRAFVLQLHLKAYDLHIETMKAEAIVPVVTWRNIADTIISYDEMMRIEGARGVNFVLYMDDSKYLAMPDQARYRYLIQYMLPWHVNFYIGWRKQGQRFARYEVLADDPVRYFTEIINGIAGSVDGRKLEAILSENKSYSTLQRFNVGINGRANAKMNAETKAILEAALSEHFEDLSELIRELPWNEGASASLVEPRHVVFDSTSRLSSV